MGENKKREKLMIIDGSSLLFRAFYALPLLTTREGIYTNAMYGFLTMLYSAIEENKPDYISVAFDKSGPTFRHEMYEDYKGTRTSPPEEIKGQFDRIKEILGAMNINNLESSKYEADDIAGTLAKKAEKDGLEVVIVTGDRDYLQLASDNIEIVITKKGITETEKYNKERIIKDYGIRPDQLIDLKGLMGDSSDNIPGVPGIGEKTGLKLIQDFGSIDGVYKNIDQVTGKKRVENLLENKDLAYLSKELGTIVCDAELGVDLKDLVYEEPDLEKLMPLFSRYEFTSFLGKYSDEYTLEEDVREAYEFEILSESNLADLFENIGEEKLLSFKFIIEDEDYMRDKVLYFASKTKDSKIYILDMEKNKEFFIANFKPIFEDGDIVKLGHNIKDDIILLFRMGIEINNIGFDTMIGSYLIDPSKSSYSINDISLAYDGYYGRDDEELRGKGKKKKKFKDLEVDDLYQLLAFYVDVPLRARGEMEELMEEQEMVDLFHKIELPLVKVLASMEYYGFKIDKSELAKLDEEFGGEISSLVTRIYDLAGRPFNVNSPKQLGEILFDDLGLPVIKKTKTGYSTNAEVLDKLKGEHEIIDLVLRYRELAKLKSTYVDGLLDLVNEETGRIHSTFNQTITTTGRISSTEPNLQNIPIRTHDGRQVRRAFVADCGKKLVDADYSQIELRVLAHISEDEHMIEAFNENQDIHSKTASQVFNVDLDKVTKDLRSKAKAVNFGIIYGISDYGLSRDLNISRAEAKEYIDSYLGNYENVKAYMEDIVDFGRQNGYVETILHRRRYIPELKNKNFNIRSFGERIAMNTPIQGSAADIIKMSMVKVYEEIKSRKLRSRLILQVHDELIIETYEDELEEVKEMLKSTMEGIIGLRVPLTVDLKTGDSWYETL